MRSKVNADTRTPAPKPTTAATTRRGGEVNKPRTTPMTKLELARDPYSNAVAMAPPSPPSTDLLTDRLAVRPSGDVKLSPGAERLGRRHERRRFSYCSGGEWCPA